jgi:hypothetical protein
LFLSKPVYLLLCHDQLVILSLGFIFICFILVLDFDSVGLRFALVDLWWQRSWRRVGVEVLMTSVSLGGASIFVVLAGACYGGGHVGLL